MNNLYLIEDHDEALKAWRQNRFRGLDLVHLDAHIDFGFHSAKPVEKILSEARSLKELKTGLEHNLAYLSYEKNLDKQTNIGNYIYPAMEEGIVKNFYWVAPGELKEFKQSLKSIKKIVRNLLKKGEHKTENKKWKSKNEIKGIISTNLLGRKLIICTLEKLPYIKRPVLLDIDTDFLVIDKIIDGDNTTKIGKRKPWILPKYLVLTLKKKIKNPKIITIAYSVNGGWTPLKYKHIGDEIAFNFAPRKFKNRFKNNLQAGEYFNLFESTGEKKYYWKAVKLNPTYRAMDNNYGPLYLSLRKFSFAKKEFLKILSVDPKNPACLLGLGNIGLGKKDFKNARKYFSSALNSDDDALFKKLKNESLLGLAKVEYNLKNFDRAKELLSRYQTLEPLQSESYYILGRICEKERDFKRSVALYKDALRFEFHDFYDIELIWRLLRISRHLELKEKEAIIKYIIKKYKKFKRELAREKSLMLKKRKKIRTLHKIEDRILSIEKILSKNQNEKQKNRYIS